MAHTRDQTPQEVAPVLGVHEQTIRRWCAREHCPAPHDRDGARRILVNARELRAWMKATGTTGKPGRPDDAGPAGERRRAEDAALEKWARENTDLYSPETERQIREFLAGA